MVKLNLTIFVAAVLAFSLGCNENSGIQPKLQIGDKTPSSQNRTVEDPNQWYEVSTMDTKVPLYKWNIAQLIEQGKPFLAVFGTPQHCTMCVDQIRRVAIMAEQYGERFAFVHVDGYKDNAVWVEWGVTGEPWTYIVNSEGTVTSILPGQTEFGLLAQEIDKVITENQG